MRRFIIEMGMGNDLHGMDYTKAAERAIQDALRHSSIPMFGALGLPHDDMEVRVTIGAQDPGQVDTAALAASLPRGRASVTATHGGLNVDARIDADDPGTIVIVSAAVEAFLPSQSDTANSS